MGAPGYREGEVIGKQAIRLQVGESIYAEGPEGEPDGGVRLNLKLKEDW